MQPWQMRSTPAGPQQFYGQGEPGAVSYAPSGPLASVNPANLATASLQIPLPAGWERTVDDTGRVYFIDHINKTTSWEDPRRKIVQPQAVSPGSYIGSPTAVQTGYPSGTMGGYSLPAQGFQPSGPFSSGIHGTTMAPGLAQSSMINPALMGTGRMSTNVTATVYGNNLSLKAATFAPQNGPKCTKCLAEFGAVFNRAYQCRCCSREFCDDCSSHSRDIKSLKLTGARCCDFCFGHLAASDEACLCRLIPYLKEANEENKLQAINETAALLLVARNMEAVVELRLVDTLWGVIGNEFGHIATAENKSRAIGCLSLIASKTISLTLSPERVALLARNMATPGVGPEAIKCIAFLAMQGQNKPMLMGDPNILPTLMQILSTSTSEGDLQWSAMAIYYLASASLDDVVPQGLGQLREVYPLVRLLQSQSEKLLQFATGILEIIAVERPNKQLIYENGGVEAIVHLLSHPGKEVKTNSIAVLSSLALHDGSRKAMIQLHATKNLIDLIESTPEAALQQQGLSVILKLTQDSSYMGLMDDLVALLPFISNNLGTKNDVIQNYLLEVLAILARDPGAKAKIGSSGVIHSISTMIGSLERDNVAKCRTFLNLFPTLASGSETNLKIIVESGALTSLLELLGLPSQELVFEAIRVMATLSSEPNFDKYVTPEITGLLQGILVEQLYSQHLGIQENVLKIFANLMSDPQCRSNLFSEVGHISKLLSSPHTSIQVYAAQILNSLGSVDGQSDTLGRAPGFFSDMINLLSSGNPLVREQGCLALLSCAAHSPANREVLFNTPGGVSTLVRLMGIPDEQIKSSAAQIISLYSMEPKYRKTLRDQGCFPVVIETLLGNYPAVEKYSALILSNLVTTEQDAQQIYQLGGVLSLAHLLSSSSPEVVASASVAVANLSHSEICRQGLVEAGIVPKLCALMATEDPNLQFQSLNALSALSADLKVAQSITENNGLHYLALMLFSENAEIVGHTVQVILNICRADQNHWPSFISVCGAKGLIVLAESVNLEAQRLAVHTLAELSTDLKNHTLIYQADGTAALLRLLAPDPTGNRPMGSILMIESIMVLANLSHDPQVGKEIVRLNGIQFIVPFLNKQYGDSSLYSAARIAANFMQLESAILPSVVAQFSQAGAIPVLHNVLLDSSIENVEVKQNVLSTLAILATDPKDVAALGSREAVFLYIGLLGKQYSEVIRKNSVLLLARLSTHDQCRKEMLNKDCLNALFTATLEMDSRYNVLEIISSLTKQDESVADKIDPEQLGFLLHILIEELSKEDRINDQLLLDILADLSVGSPTVRSMLLQFENLFPMLQFVMSNSKEIVQAKVLNVLQGLAMEQNGKQRLRTETIRTLLAPLVAPAHVLCFLPKHAEAASHFSGLMTALLTRLIGKVSSALPQQSEGPQLIDLLGTPSISLSNVKIEPTDDSPLIQTAIVSVLATLSFSEENRNAMLQQSSILVYLNESISNEAHMKTPEGVLLLVKCLDFIDHLFYDATCRQFFTSQKIVQRLFCLLSDSQFIELTQQLLSLISKITFLNENEKESIQNHGIMPLISLLSNADDVAVIQTLEILNNYVHFDSTRAVIAKYMDKPSLYELLQSTNPLIKKLSTSLKRILG